MKQISFSAYSLQDCLPETEINDQKNQIQIHYQHLIQKEGKGNDFLGWLDLPDNMPSQVIDILRVTKRLQDSSEIVVLIGIGGSYLGARAVIEMLSPYFRQNKKKTEILYAGNHLSEEYLHDLIQLLDNKHYSLIMVSKSGTTIEPAIAFRVLKAHCEQKYGKAKAKKRIVVITDQNRGALKRLANQEGYDAFVIPDDVGGRYSVLSTVGLLPIAVAGFDIVALLRGAKYMKNVLYQQNNFENNIAWQYATARYCLYKHGRKIELMLAYEPKLFYFIEWFKQLFGESEGKKFKGIFPVGALFTTDLHSLGQYIQEGERMLFETVLSVKNTPYHQPIPPDEDNLDGLNYLQYRKIQEINHIAEEGTRKAHLSGTVPNLRIEIPELTEEVVGQLIFFFEFTCALSAYLLEVNPFDQPGVEAYKKNMLKLLEN